MCGQQQWSSKMTVTLGKALRNQMVEMRFSKAAETFVQAKLGKDILDAIPYVNPPEGYQYEDDYPQPWKKPKDLSADIVKGVLPLGRPFIVCRYFKDVTSKSIGILVMEFFFQRYSSQKPMELREYGPGFIITQSLKNEADNVSNWTSTNVWKGNICNGYMNDRCFEILKAILENKDLETTGKRRLPLFNLSGRYN